MDGSYNHGFRPPHGRSSLSPETPTSAYQTNVKRTKTKKWVEAKTQNYDGDDWGNDFEDEDGEPEESIPPLKSTGSRQSNSSQTNTTILPSHQPPTPQSAEPLPAMRPPQPAVNETGLSTSPRATACLPPLQIQNQSQPAPPVVQPVSDGGKPPIVSGPSSMDTVSEKGQFEKMVSPQSASIGPPSASSVPRHEYPQGTLPPVGSRRTSPAPQQPRFPPRKSSMGQFDVDRQSNSRSSSTHPPWVEQRSGSPANPRSPGTPSSSKAQSFMRPPDVYRRLDDEKDKSRASTDSGRPSLDSAAGSKTDRSVSPAKSPARGDEAGDQGSRGGMRKTEVEDAAQRNQRPALEPVAERRSEYGFDHLLSQSQNQDQPAGLGNNQQGSLVVPELQLQRPTHEEVAQNRRYSTSPRLPDLARMSLFGDDFFSNPGKLAVDVPPMPTPKHQPQAASSSEDQTSKNQPASTATITGEKSPLPTIASTSQLVEPERISGQNDKMEESSLAKVLPSKDSGQLIEPPLASQPSRPSLPGGWVTETRSLAGEQTPPAVAEKNPSASLVVGDVSPISDGEGHGLRDSGVETVNDRGIIPVSVPEVSERATSIQEHADQVAEKSDADIKPLAPLNPRPSSSNSPSYFVAPETLQREPTMSTITSPSPVKESDKLREEIMRSLSPVRPTSDSKKFSRNPTLGRPAEGNEIRESTYLHGVYDDYWAATEDKPEVPGLRSKPPEPDATPAAEKDVSEVPPLSRRKEVVESPSVPGRRFSWEAGSEQVTSGPAEPQKDIPSDSQLQHVSVAAEGPSPRAQDDRQSKSTQSTGMKDDAKAHTSTAADEAHIAASTNIGAEFQVSQASSMRDSGSRDKLGSETIEPPSPVSLMAEQNNGSAAPPQRLSLAEEKSVARVSSNPVSPSPPPGEHPALAQTEEAISPSASPAPSQQQSTAPAPVKMATFREIMELSSASDRIIKYNETREQFALMDSGLNNWLVTLKSQYPEHANATASFGIMAPSAGQPLSSPTASQPTPYYQQYLNASSTNLNTVGSGRPPANSISMGSHSPSSDFKHSSGQVGAKGKGLLLAAGKAGKGLLSKGKNKLRGTGDKSESYPPPLQSQPKFKAERRTSWGLSLGTRPLSRPDGHAHSALRSGSSSGPGFSPHTIPERSASPTPQHQLPNTSHISPLNTLTQGKQAPAWTPPRPQIQKNPVGVCPDRESEPVSPVSDAQSIEAPRHQEKGNDESFKGLGGGDLHVPRPISKTQPTWDPPASTPLVEEEGFEMGLSRELTPHAHHAPPPASAVAQAKQGTSDDQSDDWVVVSPHSPQSEQILVLSPSSSHLPLPVGLNESSREVHEDENDTGNIAHEGDAPAPPLDQFQSRQQLPSHQQNDSPHRHSSFVGLPPIRRSSTFGVNLTRRAKKRFSLDEDDEDGNVLVSSPNGGHTADPHGSGATNSSRLQQREPDPPAQSTQTHRIETELPASRKDGDMSYQVSSATSTQVATLATESTGVDLRAGDEKRPSDDPRSSFRPGGPVLAPIDTEPATQNNGRISAMPYGPSMQSNHGILSPTSRGNSIHHLPPQGPWKLEESHLSEPLAASRNRQSGSSGSPLQPFFGFDKETGVPSPTALRSETQLPPRQRFSEVPPSSAQRYPGLFSNPQGYPNPTSPSGPRSSHDLGRQFYDRDSASLLRTRTGGSEVSSFEPSIDEERGRGKRASSFFKEIGGRLSRNSSRERHNTKVGDAPSDHPADADLTHNHVSEASIGKGEVQDQQRRRSSFFLNLKGSRTSGAPSPRGQDGDGVTPSPKASPNLGTSPQLQQPAGFDNRKRSLLSPPGKESSTFISNLSRSSTSTAGNDPAGGAMGSPKKRFSGFAGKMLNRKFSQQDLRPPQAPGTSHSMASSFHSLHSTLPGSSSPSAAQGRDRSNTTGSGPFGLYQINKQVQAVGEEGRGRRSSAGGFFSGLFGRRSSAKNQDAQESTQSGPNQNGQVPTQFSIQEQDQRMPPSSLGPRRPSRQVDIGAPAQQLGHQLRRPSHPQGQEVPASAGAVAQLQCQAPQQEQRELDERSPPSTHSAQSPAFNPIEQHRHVPTVRGGKPVSDMGSDAYQAQHASSEKVDRLSQMGPEQPFNRVPLSVRDAEFSAPAPQGHPEQTPPRVSRPVNQRQHSPSVPQAGEQSSYLGLSSEQTQAQQLLVGANETAQQPPEGRQSGQEQVIGHRTSSLPQTQSSPSQAVGILRPDPARRPSGQSESLGVQFDIRSQSCEGAVNQSDKSQHSSILTSPMPPATFQMQPPANFAVRDRQVPTPGSSQGLPGLAGSRDAGQYNLTDQPPPAMTAPVGYQQPPPPLQKDSGPARRSLPRPNHPSSLLHSSEQSQHTGDQGQQGSVPLWFKNGNSSQAAQPQSQQAQPKESKTKSLFSALKRLSKLPEPRPLQPHHGEVPQPQIFQTREGHQIMPPYGPPAQRNSQPLQGPHLMYQQQRQTPSSMGSFGQRQPPPHGLPSGGSDVSHSQVQAPQDGRPTSDQTMMTRAVPAGPGQPRVMHQPQDYAEPTYDQVPIPRGYAAVHGEGGIAPSPYDIRHPSPQAQYPYHQTPQVEHWGQPPGAQWQSIGRSMNSQAQSQAPQNHQFAQNQLQSAASLVGERRVSSVSHQSHTSQISHIPQPGFTQEHQHQQQDPRASRGTNDDISRDGVLNSQVNPQVNQQVYPQANRQILPQEQLPPGERRHSDENAGHNGVTPQPQPLQDGGSQEPSGTDPLERQVRANDVSQAAPNPSALLHSRLQASPAQALAIDNDSLARSNSHGAPPDSHAVADRSLTSESQTLAPPHLSINVQKANQEAPDDIYDSTPRLPSGQPASPAQPVAAARTGQSQVSESSADEAPRNASHAEDALNGTGSTAAKINLARGKSTRAELEDTEDERMRTMRLKAQEKILIDPYQEVQSSGNKYRKEDDPGAPQMSATSYPGQEWNPYGAGGYEDWE